MAPLVGITVLDLTQFLAGPFGSQILSDLGAEIIKVEPPEGDLTRHVPPYFIGEKSAYFCSVNRNKRSVVLNLKHPSGRDLCLQLAATADVVLENFRPGVLERLQLTYEDFKKANDKIVMCSISGFGQTGPYRDRPAYDAIVQALAGTMSLTGETDRPPVRLGVPLGDLAAGMYAAIATQAALLERERTQRGQYIDISMLDAQITMLSYQAVYYLVSGEVPQTQGRGHVSIPTYRSFACGDGTDIIVTANTERMWQSLCDVLGLPEIGGDSRFATNHDRLLHKEVLWTILEPRFLTKPASEWLERLEAAGVPAAPVNTIDRALSDPQVVERHMVVEASDRSGRMVQVIGDPMKFADADPEPSPVLAELGEDTADVLREMLGLSTTEIEHLVEEGAVGIYRLDGKPGAEHVVA